LRPGLEGNRPPGQGSPERQAALKAAPKAFRTAPWHEFRRFTVKKSQGPAADDRVLFRHPSPTAMGLSDRSGHKKETGIAATSWLPKIHRTGAYQGWQGSRLHHDVIDRDSALEVVQPLSLNRAEAAADPLAAGLASAHGQRLPSSAPDGWRPRARRRHRHPSQRSPSFQGAAAASRTKPASRPCRSGSAPEPGGEGRDAGRHPAHPRCPRRIAGTLLRPEAFYLKTPTAKIYRTALMLHGQGKPTTFTGLGGPSGGPRPAGRWAAATGWWSWWSARSAPPRLDQVGPPGDGQTSGGSVSARAMRFDPARLFDQTKRWTRCSMKPSQQIFAIKPGTKTID